MFIQIFSYDVLVKTCLKVSILQMTGCLIRGFTEIRFTIVPPNRQQV